jgi:magnesium chelatase accessory protein
VQAADVWDGAEHAWPNPGWSRFVQAGGLRWHLQQHGSGESLLLIHGTGASTHSWRKIMPILAQQYTVLAVDLPGHGLTDSAPAACMSIAGMSDCLAALLRAIEVDVRYCVGHSAGAVILCRMALDGHIAPRVVVSENGAFAPLAGAAGSLFSPIARLMASSALVPRLLSWSARNPANVARMIAGTGSCLDAEGIELYARLVRDPRHVAGALAMMANWDLYAFASELPKLKTPLTLVVAENDRAVPPRQAEWVTQRVAGARIRRIPGLGHLAHEEDPPLLAREFAAICGAWPPPLP